MEANRTRNNAILLRVTPSERYLFEKLFSASRFENRNDFVLAMLKNGRIINLYYDMDIIKDIRTNLYQIGNNINQIARRANMEKSISKHDVDLIINIGDEIKECTKQFKELLNIIPGGKDGIYKNIETN
ncbi:MobC family plasmid mobilization relaxosome protein [Peptoniphilus sp. GNH]|nr:MobC family plasmid mobilization relaxosome protein [Peptoniphilus sp. GNH]